MISRKLANRLSSLFVLNVLPKTEYGEPLYICESFSVQGMWWRITYQPKYNRNVWFGDPCRDEGVCSDDVIVKDIHIKDGCLCISLEEGSKVMVKIDDD